MSYSDLAYAVSPQYVLISKNSSERNVLDIDIKNSGSEPLDFKNDKGLSVKEYPTIDESNTDNGISGFYIYFDYGSNDSDITEYSDGSDIVITMYAENWEVSDVMHNDDVGYYWIVAPKCSTIIKNDEDISLRVSNLKCNDAVGTTKVHLKYIIGEFSFTKDIDIIKRIKLGYNLDVRAPKYNLTVSYKDSFEIEITNCSADTKNFYNPNKYKPELFPAYDDFETNQECSAFYMYFKYGDESGQMTKTDDSVNIDVSVLYNPNWKVDKSESPTVGEFWKICPDGTTQLDPGDSLTIYVQNVNVNDLPGQTPAFIELRSGEDIDRYIVPFYKNPKPEITSFETTTDSYDINDNVTFAWEIEDNDHFTLTLNGNDVSHHTKSDLKIQDRVYALTATNYAGYSVTKEFTPTFEFITSFEAVSCDGEYVEVEWETKNTDRCDLTYCGPVEANGKRKVPAKQGTEDVFTFTLRAYAIGSGKPHDQTLEFSYAKITQFDFHDRFASPPPELNIDFKDDEDNPFISLNEIRRLPIVPAVAVPYDGYSPVTWTKGIEWNGNYVRRYELKYELQSGQVECMTFDNGGYHWEKIPADNIRRYTLRAYGLSDTYDEKTL